MEKQLKTYGLQKGRAADMPSINHGVVRKPQRDALLNTLSDLLWHPHYALARVGGVRYSARLLELKRLGYKIEDEDLDKIGGKKYRLLSTTPSAPQGKKVKAYLEEGDAAALCRGILTPTAISAVQLGLDTFLANKNKL